MPRRGRKIAKFFALLLGAAAILLVFRQGLVPARWSPLPLLSLEQPGGILVDWQLAALRRDPEICRRVLVAPAIEAAAGNDRTIENGCGWTNAFRLGQTAGAKLTVDTVSCPLAAALTLWMTHDVQPLARSILNQRVTAVQHMGVYSCRNIIGSDRWHGVRSEHATANAIDIAGFTLADGRRITVGKNWRGSGPESEFLKAVHGRACRYFRVVLGPDYNAAHRDHFHLDRGIFQACG